jgi:hypothetical protein
MRVRALLALGLGSVVCTGCGLAVTQPSPTASTQGASLAQPTRVTAKRASTPPCRSYPPKRSGESGASSTHLGACSSSDLSAAMAIATRFKRTVATGGDVCDLLTPYMRANAERWAREPVPANPGPVSPRHRTCSTILMYNGNAATFTGANPVGMVLTFPASSHTEFEGRVGPSPRGAIICFRAQGHSRVVNIVAVDTRSGWLIDQVGYQF